MSRRLRAALSRAGHGLWSLRVYVLAGLLIVGALIVVAALAGRANPPDLLIY
jgi:hypothetical protein